MIGPRLGTTAFDKQQLLTASDGFLARAYANVFQSIEANQPEMHVAVRASCCEVYHEQVTYECYWGKQGPGQGKAGGGCGGFQSMCRTCISSVRRLYVQLFVYCFNVAVLTTISECPDCCCFFL